jgi:hypothetical protein
LTDEPIPPKFVPLLIRDFNGKIIAGTITQIDQRSKMFRVSDVLVLELVGFKHGLEPIYGVKRRGGRFEVLSLETISHWENLPEYLKNEK